MARVRCNKGHLPGKTTVVAKSSTGAFSSKMARPFAVVAQAVLTAEENLTKYMEKDSIS